MGSGRNNRKKDDSPYIRRPKSVFASGLGVPDLGEIAAETCIPSFEKKIVTTNLTQPGVTVRLQKGGEVYYIMIGSNEVGKLSEQHSKMVSQCSKMGVRYVGEIILKSNGAYARFNRVS